VARRPIADALGDGARRPWEPWPRPPNAAAVSPYDATVTSPLAAPLTLPCGAVLPNRIAKAAMTEALGDGHDDATPALERLYRRWSGGGAGLLISGHLLVDRRFLEQAGNVVLDDDTDVTALRAWVAAGTHAGNHLWAQLNHPGRQTTRFHSDRPVAPSAVKLPIRGFFARPRALEEAEIVELIAAFARSAGIARRAGFTGVQVHAAHGYLISQFLSPRTNRRDDAWGGPLEGRARFLLEVVRAVRAEVGRGFPVAVKINSSDFQRGGFEHHDAVEVARLLAAEGIDLLEISGGTYERVAFAGEHGGRPNPETPGDPRSAAARAREVPGDPRSPATRAREAYFVAYAQAIRAAMPGVPLMVSGGFRTPAYMAEVLRAGEADVLGIARPFCVEPEFPARLLAGSPDPLPSPEERIRIGRGWVGPHSPSADVRAYHAQAAIAWFYRQIERLGAGEEPESRPGAGVPVLLRYLWREWRRARRRRELGEARRAA
jgi:2,4-dienoyl-CoA reductase-like NADH-dependent reductase (Old Yellow Enzyme family)